VSPLQPARTYHLRLDCLLLATAGQRLQVHGLLPRSQYVRGDPILAILFFGFELCPAQAEEPGLLDGMKFEGSLTEDGSKAAPFEETLIFENGEFLSKACIPYGFGKAPYKATRGGDRIKWSAVVPNSDSEGDKAEWSGSVVGDKLTGKMTWSKANETIDYTVDAETPR
jgi:hypothetical protein